MNADSPRWSATNSVQKAGGGAGGTSAKATWNDPKTVAGFQWIVDVYQKWKISPPNPASNSRTELWSSKKLAMALSGMPG